MQNSVYFRTSHSASESEDEAPDTHAEDFSFSDFSLLPSLKESRAALRSELLDPFVRPLFCLLSSDSPTAITVCTLSIPILVS